MVRDDMILQKLENVHGTIDVRVSFCPGCNARWFKCTHLNGNTI